MSHDNIIIVLALINIQLLIATSTIIYNYLSGSENVLKLLVLIIHKTIEVMGRV
ncbi:hypothetical protein RhiirA1_486862 [Rhizophagus irregularis]|uniref:Uncharacterized protein n=1 Tax=Rhizophagus irregularis TaxID=588596 RepID=A0A2N0QGU6_9GLOM|nr:hypothetical protein RhiirA1_486862 [Rhizophagus irregularis]